MAIKIKGSIVIDNGENLSLDGTADIGGDTNIGIVDGIATGANLVVDGNITLTSDNHINMQGAKLAYAKWLDFCDFEDIAETSPSVRLLRKDNNLHVWSGGLVVGSYNFGEFPTNTAYQNLGSGNMQVKRNIELGGELKFVNGKVDFGGDYPCFRAVLTTDYTWTAGSWQHLKFNSEGDSVGGFDVAQNHPTNTGIFTAPVDGIYKFDLNIAIHGMDEGAVSAGARFVQNGSENIYFTHIWDTNEMLDIGRHESGADYWQESHSLAFGTMINCKEGDTVHVEVYTNDRGDGDTRLRGIDASSGHGSLSWWEGRLISGDWSS